MMLRNKERMEESSAGELLEAHVDSWNFRLNYIKAMALKCGIELGIPEAIHQYAKPIPLSTLVDAVEVHPTKAHNIRRLMRLLVHSGFFSVTQDDDDDHHHQGGQIAEDGEGHKEPLYWLTPHSFLLLKHEPYSTVPGTLLNLNPFPLTAFCSLSKWFRSTDRTPFETAHGTLCWDMNARNSQTNQNFNDALAIDSKLVANFVVKECREVFQGLGSLVDVGGGTGTMAKAIAEAFPHVKCTVLDLPPVVAGLQGTPNLCYIAGDMFDAAIPSADALLLKNILHNWNDEKSMKILNRCKEAIQNKDGGKVIIIDMVFGSKKEDKRSADSQLLSDMLMMTIHDSKERTEKEWRRLFLATGFSNYKITPLPGLTGSLIEAYPQDCCNHVQK